MKAMFGILLCASLGFVMCTKVVGPLMQSLNRVETALVHHR